MIKPPFTLLILKDSHNPVTIRVTLGFLLGIILIPLVFLAVGYIAASYVDIPGLPAMQAFLHGANLQISDSGGQSGPGIVHLDSDNNLTIAYTPAADDTERSFFFWVIVNPDSRDTGERIIYPRNPISRGYPIDYRNGIPYRYDGGSGLTIPLHDEVGDIGIDEIRILAYNTTGELVLDRIYSQDDSDDR